MAERRAPRSRWALAVALLVGAGATHAQTSVTLYGVADGNLRIDHTALGNLRSLGSGGEDASRWGLRGSEDLGNGIRARFAFEQDFDLGDSSVPQGDIGNDTPVARSSTGSRLFGRRAVVGLASAAYGEVRLGRERTAFYELWKKADPFDAGTVSRANNYAVGNLSRFDNSVTYESPRVAGVQLELQYRAGESRVAFPDTFGNGASASLSFEHGPLYVGVGVLSTRQPLRTIVAETLVMTYDFDVVKLHALAFHSKRNPFGPARSYALGATVPIGAFELLAVAARYDDRTARGVPNDASTNEARLDDANFFGFGATYSFSKRTDLYLAGAKVVNNAAAAFVLGDNGNEGLYTSTNVPAGFDPWSAQFGIRHRF